MEISCALRLFPGLILSPVLGIYRLNIVSIILGFCFLAFAVVFGWGSIRSARSSACFGLTLPSLNPPGDLFIQLHGTACKVKDRRSVAQIGPFTAEEEAEEWLRKRAFSRENIQWILNQESNLEVRGVVYLGLPVGGLVACIHKLDSPQDVTIVVNRP